jgi:3',5'-cyclic AMP phosphodiesterase CpdA
MTVTLHMSDPHFGTEQPPVVEALARMVQAQSPELVILSGDITQRAKRSEFDAARQFIDRLDIPARLVIPGNHDIPMFQLGARLFTPYARYRHAFGADLEPIYETAELLVIGVKTTRRYRHIEGEVSTAQIDRVASRLRQASAAQLRIVVTHQPVHVTHPEDEKNLLNGHEEAIRRWAGAGADLILGGHIHRPYVCELHEQFADIPRRIWAVQAGTALSSRTRRDAGNSVNLIRYGLATPGHCIVERWDYDRAAQAFMLAVADEMTCER